jgi:hypothetical protein
MVDAFHRQSFPANSQLPIEVNGLIDVAGMDADVPDPDEFRCLIGAALTSDTRSIQ